MKKGFNTRLVHKGEINDQFGSVVTPIYQSSTFVFENAQQGADRFSGKDEGFIYSRLGNPTVKALEDKLASLENGNSCTVFSSGMAAVSTVYTCLLKNGDHMISSEAVYGPSRSLMEGIFAGFGVESSFVDSSIVKNISDAIQDNTKLIYIETPANPTLQLTDLKKVVALAKKHNILVCVDNTFSSPYLQKPLDFGVDISLHSLTKFINGHADIVGGAVMTKDKDLGKRLNKTMYMMGGNMDPNQAYLVMRGVKTLSIRMDKAEESALKIATFLENHLAIGKVNYPGLKSFPQHELAKEQQTGFGAMMSFEVKKGHDAGVILMNNVKLAALAVSLGGIETLIEHPSSMTHAGVSAENKLKAGITDGLVRLSVGIENVEDIINDLEQALSKIG